MFSPLKKWKGGKKKIKFEQMQQCVKVGEFTSLISCLYLSDTCTTSAFWLVSTDESSIMFLRPPVL